MPDTPRIQPAVEPAGDSPASRPASPAGGPTADPAAPPGDHCGSLGRTRRSVRIRRLASGWVAKSLLVLTALALGFGMGQIEFTAPPTTSAESLPLPSPMSGTAREYLASTARRNEPILPLVPFDSLDPGVVELGNRLFHDPGLSGNGRVACASCHALETGGVDGRKLPLGVTGKQGKYNTLSVLNAAYNYALFWDGRAATLEEQIDDPLLNPAEMNSSWDRVIKYLQADGYYPRAFNQLMGGPPTPERVRDALAEFERSLITLNSRFDQWLTGKEEALSADEYGGYFLFKKFNCVSCHQGYGVGGTMFQPMGALATYFSQRDNHPADLGRFHVTQRDRDRYVFRVPPLRNVTLTAPYFHDGSVDSLEQAVAIMLEYQCGEDANAEDIRRLTAFLQTLTGDLPVRP